MSNRQYFKAEALKHRHTVLRKLLILMPVICVALAAFLTHVFFAVDGYNWWYMGMYPGFVALVCGTICEKEKKMKNRAILALPCDMGRVWDAKVLYGILMSGAAMLLLVLLVLAVAFILEHVLNVTFIIRPSLFSQLEAGVLLWLSFCWQIPWCLLLSQMLGRTVMLLVHFVLYDVMAIFLSLSPFYMLFPGAIGARMMCPVLGILPNGLPAQSGEMTFAPRLLDGSSIPIGMAASVIWFLLLWEIGRIYYERRMKRV